MQNLNSKKILSRKLYVKIYKCAVLKTDTVYLFYMQSLSFTVQNV